MRPLLSGNAILPLADHPVVVAAAEAMAWEFLNVWPDNGDEWPYHGFVARSLAAWLCDLSRTASRDWWARWLASGYGLKFGATAPRFGLTPYGDWAIFGDNPHEWHAFMGMREITDSTAALHIAILRAIG